MPGLHLLISTGNIESIEREKRIFTNKLEKMKHFPWYLTEVLYNDSRAIMGRSFYDGYPFTVLRSDNGVTLIDGAIYNKSPERVRGELDKISLEESSPIRQSSKVKEFLLSTNGEFIITKYDKEKRNCLIFNDALGRLPFYCILGNQPSTKIVISREIKFLIPFLDRPDFDLWALAEYLLFGYSLGEETIWRDIKRLPPATMLTVDMEKKRFLSKKVLCWKLDSDGDSNETTDKIREEMGNLLDLFVSSLKEVAGTFPKDAHVVSLSGGLDSRATLAGLLEIGANPTSYSFPSAENRIAKKVAEILNTNYEILSSSFEISGKDYVKLTDGLFDMGLRHLVPYLFEVKRRMGSRAILYTGDGGDKTLAPLGLGPNIKSLDNLLEHIVETDHIFDLDEISSLLNIQKRALMEHIKKHLLAYPETTLEGKFVHFKVFERAFKWLFAGEDRNRMFLWSVTPFYSVPFFRASMKLPQHLKKHYKLYKNFLLGLNPWLPRIQYYDRLVRLSIPDCLLRLYLDIFEWLKRNFHEPGTSSPLDLLGRRSNQQDTEEARKLTLQFLDQKNVVSFFELSRVREKIRKETNPAKLNTLTSLLLYTSLMKLQNSS